MQLLCQTIQDAIKNLNAAEESGNVFEARIIKAMVNTSIRKWGDYVKPHFVWAAN